MMGNNEILESERRETDWMPIEDDYPFDDSRCAGCKEVFSLELGVGVARGSLSGLCVKCSEIAAEEIAERLASEDDLPC